MNEEKSMRLSQVARKLNVGTDTIVSFLAKNRFTIVNKPNTKITAEQFHYLAKEFTSAGAEKKEAAHVSIGKSYTHLEAPRSSYDAINVPHRDAGIEAETAKVPAAKAKPNTDEQTISSDHYQTNIPTLPGLKRVGKLALTTPKTAPTVTPSAETDIEKKAAPEQPPLKKKIEQEGDTPVFSTQSWRDVSQKGIDKPEQKQNKITVSDEFKRPTVLGKMTLPEYTTYNKKVHSANRKPAAKGIDDSIAPFKVVAGSDTSDVLDRPKKQPSNVAQSGTTGHGKKMRPARPAASSWNKGKPNKKIKEQEEVSPKDINTQIKKTLVKLHQGSGEGTRAKYKRDKRSANLEAADKRKRQEKEEANTLKITEFISANELASLMGVTASEVLSTCMSLGMIISINQRLDAETITVLADEFGYNVTFIDVDEATIEVDIEELDGVLVERPPIVTIMGHVDHGKTSLLDYLRTTKLTAKEVGGITQHIGAYDILTESNKRIVFVDTPGHEAFTAMRTRGAKVTDIVVIVVAADDSVMPQTKESISHAQLAGCPIIIAINKIDKPQANEEKVKEDLAHLNILVEDWGGKYQCQAISAKTGVGIAELLEKILLEASLMELKATPTRKAKGTIIDSFLDAGRGYIANAIVQDGTLHIGDIILAGVHYGKVKAMLGDQGNSYKRAFPATSVQILGLNGAPRAGDVFRVMGNMKEAGELAQKKQLLLREQTLRTKSHVTLDEIGRRLAVGNFKELNIIIKGDVDGSIEAVADALLKISNEEVQVNILHKCVGAVSESDVLLAAATDALIISYHIKPSSQAKKLAAKEGVTIKQYSIIYNVIDDIRTTAEGLLAPTIEEETTGRAEIKKIFTFSKVGNIAGCQVKTGFIKQANPIRVIRNNEVIFTGSIHTIKHGLDEIKQVKALSECGIHIRNFDHIEVGDILEGFERKEIKRQL